MFKRLRSINLSKEKLALFGAVFGAVLMTLWICAAQTPRNDPQQDWTFTIPKGYLIVPLQLANLGAIARVIDRAGVVDLFGHDSSRPMAENLRVMKLTNEDPVSLGALVPEKFAGRLQIAFSRPGLRAAIRTPVAGPTKFNLAAPSGRVLREVTTGE